MPLKDSLLNIFSSIGDYTSLATEKIIKFIASYGINITATFSKVLTIFILLLFIYIVLGVLNITRKLVKFGLTVTFIILIISIIISFI